ncbi:hypothetical protein [Thiomicrorhabdus sp.]|uniref:hypothetical protein n=1 Tax=Thiomicrorhabdus sp. TaxID=2039724 RepID=UPI0029C89292|nr:hypothetical protein [Thiomicrorhabdus sp.]
MLKRLKQKAQDDWSLFLGNYWIGRKPFYTPDDPQWSQQSISFPFVWLILVGIALLFSPMPSDDLLRHVHAWQYDYDYRQMFDGYPYHFDAWFGFDWAVGQLYQYFGDFAIKIVQATSIGLLALVIYLNLRGVHRDARILVVLIVIWLVGSRFLLARPTTFETLLMFLAIALTYYPIKPKWDRLIHLTLGCLMVSFYHLFFIYLIPLLIWRRIYLLPMLLGLAGWQWLTGGQYFQEVVDIFNFGEMRIPGIKVSENEFALPLALLFIGFLVLFVYKWQRSDKQWALTAAWFTLPMQIRYVVDNLVPIIAILLARHWPLRPHPFLLLFMVIMVKTAIGGAGFYFTEKDTEKQPTYFSENEHVMAQNLGVNFWVINQGAAQHIKVAPAMEIGFSNKDVQQAVLDKTVTCEFLHKYQFDKYVENSAVDLPLTCLKLQTSTPEGYKIWQVHHE